jgi:hypothetical protein
MKSNTKLNLALAALLALAAQGASAAPTADATLYVSGATAVDRTLFEAVLDQTNGVCDATNPISVYSTATSGSTPSSYGNWLIHCTARDTATFGTGVEIGIMKSSQGSEYGIDPVANNSTSLTVNGAASSVNTVTTTCTGTGNTIAANGVATRLGYTHFLGCSTVTTQVPQVGVSDVEPALFGASAAVRNALTANGAAAVPFTVFVSTNFYRALQVAQGLTGSCATDTATTQTDACSPSLSMSAVRALLSGRASTTAKLIAGSTALTAPSGGNGILVCRRGNSSGSQKSVERLFFNQNCKATPALSFTSDSSVTVSGVNCLDFGCAWNNTTPLDLTTGVAPNGVFMGNGTGEVEKCLNWASQPTTAAAVGDLAGGDVFAVGIMSADRTPDDGTTSASKNFRYIKIDGVLPTVENVVAQKWTNTIENVVLTPTASSNGNDANYTAFRQKIGTAVLAQLRVPANLAKSASTAYAIGRIGLTTRPSALQAPAKTDTASVRPLSPFIRATSNSSPVNNCNELFVPSAAAAPVRVN